MLDQHAFQSDREQSEQLGGATNHIFFLHTRPFALLTDILWPCAI